MTTRKTGSRKKWRIAKKDPRQNFSLTQVEAEVLFIILKNKGAMTYEEISIEYKRYFGGNKAKKPGSIKVIVNKIKRLEQATERNYLNQSYSRPEKYSGHKEFVEFQRTAIMLLEADKGYRQLNDNRPLEWEIGRDDFEEYLFDTYKWDRNFISRRVKDAFESHYFVLPELETDRQFIIADVRLGHDLECLKLIVKDYYLDQLNRDPESSVTNHLANLLTLFDLGKTPEGSEGSKD